MQRSVWLEDVSLTKFLHQITRQSRMGRSEPGRRKATRDRSALQPLPSNNNNDHLNNALGAIRVLGLELTEDELRPHLTTVLSSIRDKNRGAPEQVVISGVLPVLALSLRNRGSQAVLTAKLVSELANESVVRKGFSDSGLVPALLSVLSSQDQELLTHSARAVSRMCHDSPKLQDLCLRGGAVPRLVSILFRFLDCPALEEACLLALCNLSGMVLSEDGGVVWERGVSVRPEECAFTGSAPLPRPSSAWAGSWVTVVRVCQFGPGQYSVNMEVLQRCSPTFWGLRGSGTSQRKTLFSVVRTGSNVYKVIKHWSRNIPRTKSLRTRMFHTFL